MNWKDRYLELPPPAAVASGTECQNVVCSVCNICFEHANSSNHNNSVSCICDSCRAEIEDCKNEKEVFDTAERLWREASEKGEVCEEYSYFTYLEEEKNEKEEEVWDIALHLWKTLSEMEDCEVADGDPSKFKNEILEKLGYGKKRNGCPFCEKFSACEDGCPLWPPYDHTPYAAWAEAIDEERHSQEAAKKFYEFLVELKEV